MGENWASAMAVSNPRVLVAVVVCLLVTTATGGAGSVGAAAVADTDSAETPPTVASGPQNQSFPPGTNETGITNVTTLLDAHEQRLQNTTYTERLLDEDIIAGPDRTSSRETIDPVRITIRNGTAGTNTTLTARGSHSEYWVTDDTFAEYSVDTEENLTNERYWYEEGNVSGLEVGPSAVAQIQRGILSTYVRSANYSYRGTVTRGNDTLYEFATAAGNWSNRTFEELPSSVQHVNATLLVSERGVIRELSATVDVATGNGTMTTRTRYTATAIGETTTSEPAWLTEQLPRFDVRVTNDSRVIALEYTRGATAANGTLSPRTGVFVVTENSDASTQLNATLARGDTLYLWNESGATALQQSVNDPPAVTDSFVPFGGEDASYLVARFVLTSASRGTTSSYTTIEVHVGNETAATNATVPLQAIPATAA